MVEKTPDIKKEDKDSEKSSKKLGFSSSRLELKKTIGGGTVRQSFSHGRTKSVSVEVKKVRTYKAYDTSKRDSTNKSVIFWISSSSFSNASVSLSTLSFH